MLPRSEETLLSSRRALWMYGKNVVSCHQNPDAAKFIDDDPDQCLDLLNGLLAGGKYAGVV